MAFSKIITGANFFTVNVESVDVVGCNDDAGRNGYLSNRSGEVLTKICHRIRRHGGGTSGGRPDPFSVKSSAATWLTYRDSEQGAQDNWKKEMLERTRRIRISLAHITFWTQHLDVDR